MSLRVETGFTFQRPTPWFVILHDRLAPWLFGLIGAWSAAWVFGGLGAFLIPHFPRAFVLWLAFGWIPAALLFFLLNTMTARFHTHSMQMAGEQLNAGVASILRDVENQIRAEHGLPPADRPTVQ